MTSNVARFRLLHGAAFAICGGFIGLSCAGSASAQESICTLNTASIPNTFSCTTGGSSPVTATGTASDGAMLRSGAGLTLTSAESLTVTQRGEIFTTGSSLNPKIAFASPPVSLSSDGALNYTSTGTTTTQERNTNIGLSGASVFATIGTVVANGANSTGVISGSRGGTITINGGIITLNNASNISAIGISSFTALGGGATVINTGVVTVAGVGPDNIGVRASTFQSPGSLCGSIMVNVTGNVTVNNGTAIKTDSCGTSTVNVNAIRTVSTTTGTAISNTANSAATTNVSGTVDAGAANFAINANGTSSVTTIAGGGAVIGRFDGTAGADIFTNNGSFTTSGISDFQAGADSFTNNGTLTATGATNFAGLENLTNAGTISLQNGAAGDVLTLAGNYTGTGAARLLLEVGAAGADRLVIGGAASGSTLVTVTALGGIPITAAAGLLLVDAGTATAGAFTLAGTGLSSGLVKVSFEQRGADFFLVAVPDTAAFEPLALSNMAKDMWYQSGDIYTGYAVLRRTGLGVSRSRPVSVWGQLYASRDRSGEKEGITAFGAGFDVDNRLRTTRRGAQVGVDVQPPGVGIVLGATGGYQRAEADLRAAAGGFVATGYNIGVYAIAGRATGIYAGLIAKFDKNDVRIRRGALRDADGSPDFNSLGVEGEIGYRTAIHALEFDFGAGLARVNARIDRFDAGQIGFDFDVAKSLRGRLGARAGLAGRLGPYVEGKLFHEFKNDDQVTFSNGGQRSSVDTRGRGTWGRVEAGIGGRGKSGPIAAVWGEAGDVRGFGAKAGFRF